MRMGEETRLQEHPEVPAKKRKRKEKRRAEAAAAEAAVSRQEVGHQQSGDVEGQEGSSKKRHKKKRKRRDKFVDAREELPASPACEPQLTRQPVQQQAQPAEVAAPAASAPAPAKPASQQAAVAAQIVLDWADIMDSPPGDEEKAEKKRRRKGKERKTLTARVKRNVVLKAVAQRPVTAAAPEAAAASAAAAGAAAQPATAAQPAPAAAQPPTAAKAAEPAAAAAAAAAAPSVPAVAAPVAAAAPPAVSALQPAQALPGAAQWETRNLGKAWCKDDIAELAKMAKDRKYLQEKIPHHPAGSELSWELIAKYFGRFSQGGSAVRTQYNQILRMLKEARKVGKHGKNYRELVKEALLSRPHNQGTVLELQKYLKRQCKRYLDTYKDASGNVRWKKAVGETLRSEVDLFEQVGKSATGKIIWRLKPLVY